LTRASVEGTQSLSVKRERRKQLLAEAEQLFLNEQPVIPLTTTLTNWLKKPYIKGMFPNALTLHP